MSKLKNFLSNQIEEASISDISKGTGIEEKKHPQRKHFLKFILSSFLSSFFIE